MSAAPESHRTVVRVLIADDEPLICETYQEFLAPEWLPPEHANSEARRDADCAPRYDVVCCTQAREAVDEVVQAIEAGDPFAIAFLDVSMPPGEDGVWAAERIRELDPAVEIVMVTAQTDLDPREIAARVPPADKLLYLQKPAHAHEIVQFASALGAKWRAERDLGKSQARLATAQRIAKFGHCEWEPQTGDAWWSPELSRIFGLQADQDCGPIETLWACIHPDDAVAVAAAAARTLREGTAQAIEYRIRPREGRERFIQHEFVAMPGSAKSLPRIVGSVQDVTERKRTERTFRQLAYYDQVTELPNRSFLTQHLPYVLSQAKRYRRSVALMFIDLDKFKAINDTYGHSVGDDLLSEVGRRLKSCVRDSDCVARTDRVEVLAPAVEDGDATVARFGGDEFIVLLSEVAGEQAPAVVADRILKAFNVPVRLAGEDVVVKPSIGIAVYPKDGDDAESLLKSADAAMYLAKESGRDNFQFYTEVLNAAAAKHSSLESDLRHALEAEEILLYYQPKVDLSTGAVVGAEALMRWRRPGIGIVTPSHFIPLAEETGLIVPLGEWVIENACRQLARWEQEGLARVPVSINLSSREFNHERLVRQLRESLAGSGVTPERLELEVSERVLMQDTSASKRILTELKDIGLAVAVDDFGTGYSSLTHLRRLPLDSLKIDRALIRDILSNDDDRAIVEAIIAMAQRIKLATIGEGVETRAQMELLKREGCEAIQGYLVSHPLPVEEFESQFLRGHASQVVAGFG